MLQKKISPARIFLLLSIVVGTGVVLGLILAFGKIGEINRLANQSIAATPTVSPVITPSSIENEITIKTDKTEYEQGEVVKIEFKNNTNVDYEIDNYYAVERREDENWIKISLSGRQLCGPEWIEIVPVAPDFFSRGGIINKEWNQKEWNCISRKKQKTQAAGGIYRIKFTLESKIYYSNEFVIK